LILGFFSSVSFYFTFLRPDGNLTAVSVPFSLYSASTFVRAGLELAGGVLILGFF